VPLKKKEKKKKGVKEPGRTGRKTTPHQQKDKNEIFDLKTKKEKVNITCGKGKDSLREKKNGGGGKKRGEGKDFHEN